MIFWSTIDAPFGLCLLAAGTQGLREIKLRVPDRGRGRATLERKYGVLQENSSRLVRYATSIGRYFSTGCARWDFACDESWMTPWERRVFGALKKIPAGALVTYKELAVRAGRPGGSRAVGRAMSRNQLPLVIPCHRVVASDGSLGGFSGGLAIKRFLIDLERAASGR